MGANKILEPVVVPATKEPKEPMMTAMAGYTGPSRFAITVAMTESIPLVFIKFDSATKDAMAIKAPNRKKFSYS